jgi:HPt (histidine-containing phosphotransfer) domain-containing protein
MQPAVDLAQLARYTGGDRELNVEVLRLFEAQARILLENLRDALHERDARTWTRAAHGLKGAARGIGAFALADAAAFLEPNDLSVEAAAIADLASLEVRASEVQRFIGVYLANVA